MLSFILFSLLALVAAQPPPAWDLRIDHQRGDTVAWGAIIHGDLYESIQVVSGVSYSPSLAGSNQGRPLLSWKLPRDMQRGCVSVGFDLEVMISMRGGA